jgi:hypothetical protein
MRRLVLAMFVLLPSTIALALSPANPFNGWDDKKVETHKKTSQSRISGKLRRWQSARKGLIYQCSTCQGRGRVKVRRGRVLTMGNCATCVGTGGCISKDKFLKVFWEFRSPKFRSSTERMKEVEALYKKARAKPKDAIEFLEVIDKWKRKSIDVKGNFAAVTFSEKKGGAEMDRTVEWIYVDGKWWVADKEVDSGFVRYSYEDREKPGAAETAPKTEPEKKPDARPEKTADPKPETTRPDPEPVKPPPPKPKKKLEDPDNLFRLSDPVIRHVEENAWKVIGQVTNKTEKRRFAYITVEVSLYQGEVLVDSVTCNAGTVILKPGRSGSYVGHFYFDKKPKYDKIVARIASYEEME